LIGEIEEFIQNDKSPFYKLDQKQSNVWIQLFQRDNGKKDKDGKELKKTTEVQNKHGVRPRSNRAGVQAVEAVEQHRV